MDISMKTQLIAAATIALAQLAGNTYADEGGSCHFHGRKAASEATVQGCAVQRKEALVKSGKLDAAWAGVQAATPEMVDGKKGKEWKVVFKDPKAQDKSKETLYMFFTAPGNFIAANSAGASSNCQARLAKEVLAEIPDQFIGYMKMCGIRPGTAPSTQQVTSLASKSNAGQQHGMSSS